MNRRLIIAIIVTATAVLLGTCGTATVRDTALNANHTRTTQRCEEDMPCWDCHTMGNHICGVAYWDEHTWYVGHGALPLPAYQVPLDNWGADQPLADAIASDHDGDVCAMHTDDAVLSRVRSEYLSTTLAGIDCQPKESN